MTQHPTYIELEHQLQYNRFREAAARNQQLQLLPKTKKHQGAIKEAITQPLGNLLINVGYKLVGSQPAT